MGKVSRSELAHDVLGSAHILASAVDRLVEERLQAVSKEQLTSSQLRLLRLIARTDVCRICQVATFLRVSPAATSKAVDRLVRRGLVRRREAEADRRRAELRLTEEGLNLLAQCEVIADQVLEEVFGAISADGLRQAADLLDRCCVSVLTRDSAGAEACFRCSSYFREKCLLWRSGGEARGSVGGAGVGMRMATSALRRRECESVPPRATALAGQWRRENVRTMQGVAQGREVVPEPAQTRCECRVGLSASRMARR
jgi:DNA-binding MarR family transcriptional regulator